MTPIDTAALRALADLADTRSKFAFTEVDTDDLRALCDGYDEAARLRDRLRLSDIDGINLLTERLRAEADADAARQALADLIADLRALCDAREHIAPSRTVPAFALRAVIDRHAPEVNR